MAISFAVTDLFVGFHNTLFFTWGSVIAIGLISKFFADTIKLRLIGSLLGACLFFVITNFGVWSLGIYGYTLDGFLLCFTLAIPFFSYTLISTLFFAAIFEGIYRFKVIKDLKKNIFKFYNLKKLLKAFAIKKSSFVSISRLSISELYIKGIEFFGICVFCLIKSLVQANMLVH